MDASAHKSADGFSGQTLFLWVVVAGCCLAAGYLLLLDGRGPNQNAEAATSQLHLKDIPFNGARAYEYLKQVCAIGPRRSGSQGMAAQQELLVAHFRKLGGQVSLQRFRIRHPLDSSPLSMATVPMANLIVHWHPESRRRILLCAHYDTLPFPMLDKQNPRGPFIGANDGGSGVAVLMELAHEIRPNGPAINKKIKDYRQLLH